MTLTAFDRAIAVRLRAPGSVADVEVDGDWGIGIKPNGGYLLAMLGNAARAGLATDAGAPHPDPVAATVHYLAAPDPGPAEIHLEVLRRGRSLSQVRARLDQGGQAKVDATFTMGLLDPESRPQYQDADPPVTTDRDLCPRAPTEGVAGIALPIMEHVDQRPDVATNGFARGEPTGEALVRAWFSFADGRPVDPLALLLAVDVLPPATFNVGSVGWVPTLTMTVYVRAVPAPGPVIVQHRARLIEADRVDETCEVWDAAGRLVAQATQLAAVRMALPA